MSTQLDSFVLEARFGLLAAALGAGASVSDATVGALASQAHMALRGFDEVTQNGETERLGRSASRLARRLATPRGAHSQVVPAATLDRIVLQLGIETGRRLDPRTVAATVLSVLSGRAELSSLGISKTEHVDSLAALFIKIALVVAIARLRHS